MTTRCSRLVTFSADHRVQHGRRYMGSLKNRIALVTGASRGVGKGVALGLGEAKATVYVTGRTVTPGTGPNLSPCKADLIYPVT